MLGVTSEAWKEECPSRLAVVHDCSLCLMLGEAREQGLASTRQLAEDIPEFLLGWYFRADQLS